MRACGLEPSTPTLAAFDMASAREYRLHIPRAPILPELEGEVRSAHVIVVQGPISIGRLGPTGVAHEPDQTLVCVIVGDEPVIYANISVQDLAP
jgi:hypothetical protein